ncbi:hypothetical protein CAPTEDRAFT_170824 [Capitella teleta]|uniref:SMB domain-containing protein n=1 Tax=Capitella teleta TaxID=283909 RepID=R7UV36_CAPTE|nr:hypothetical protein CAPTEDRAFT_170824 [Capitella teleta]|eukprot:ELU07807.1 hypothetical protein CAPTEDRAFT_170824 [Capitella teleta]
MHASWGFVAASVLIIGALAADGDGSFTRPSNCYEAQSCCQGRNNTCKAVGPRIKQPAEPSPFCFCDSTCLELGDCCLDYEEHCKAVDCVTTKDFGTWKECSSRCGLGFKERTKDIQVQPRNGGKKCQDIKQLKSCFGMNCKVARTPHGNMEARETGKIIPAEFGSWRTNKLYNPYRDIRRNLFRHYEANAIVHRPAYCARFEITSARRSCLVRSRNNPWTKELTVGSTVCVECQELAMKKKLGVRCKGHGVFNKETSWNAMGASGCHGEWVMKTRHEECRCDPNQELSLIFL